MGQIDTYKPYCTQHRQSDFHSLSPEPAPHPLAGVIYPQTKSVLTQPVVHTHFSPDTHSRPRPVLPDWLFQSHSHCALRGWRNPQPIRTLSPLPGANPQPESGAASTLPPFTLHKGPCCTLPPLEPKVNFSGTRPPHHFTTSELRSGSHSNPGIEVSGRGTWCTVTPPGECGVCGAGNHREKGGLEKLPVRPQWRLRLTLGLTQWSLEQEGLRDNSTPVLSCLFHS